MNKFKKQTCWFLIAGCLSIGFTQITRHFLNTPEWIADFLKGIGLALMLGAMVMEKGHCKNKTAKVNN